MGWSTDRQRTRLKETRNRYGVQSCVATFSAKQQAPKQKQCVTNDHHPQPGGVLRPVFNGAQGELGRQIKRAAIPAY